MRGLVTVFPPLVIAIDLERGHRSDDVEQVKQDDDWDRNPEQPKQNASTHNGLLADDKKLFLASDLASGVLCVADRTLNPAFGLIGLAFGFSAGIAQSFADLFLDLA